MEKAWRGVGEWGTYSVSMKRTSSELKSGCQISKIRTKRVQGPGGGGGGGDGGVEREEMLQ
jgi:hypothetical protein